MGLNKRLFAATAALSVLGAPATWAQPAGQQTAQVGVGSMEEIVVTARKREERLLDVPLSIQAVTGEAMENIGIKSIDRISTIDPALMYDANGTGQGGTPSIRGSSTRSTGQTETPIGVFQDGIYDSRPAAVNREPADTARVEVLKGPQGTVFGRNTIAGAISIVTNDPTDTFEGKISAEYGGSATPGDHFWGVTAVASGPLSEKLSGRVVANRQKRIGYILDRFSGFRGGLYDAELYRGKLKLKATDDLTVKLAVEHSWENRPRVDCLSFGVGKRLSSNTTLPISLFTFCGDPDLWTSVRSDFQASSKVKSDSIALTVDYDTPIGTITSLTGHKYGEWRSNLNTDQTQLFSAISRSQDRAHLFSEELRLAGSSDRWTWLAGLYFFHEVSRSGGPSISGPSASAYATGQRESGSDNFQNLNAYAAFGQLTYKILPAVDLTVGARYSSDKKTSIFYNYNLTATGPTNFFRVDRAGKWTSFDPSASITWHFTPDAMVYVSYGSGYRAGGFNEGTTVAAVGPAGYYNPERLDAYEAGVKGQLFDRRVQLSASAFIMDYKDLLINTSTRDVATNSLFTTQQNAGEARVTGFEANGGFRLTEAITLTAAVSHNHGKIDKFTPKVAGAPSFQGFPLPRMSPWSYVLGVEYNQAIGPGQINSRLSYRFRQRYANTVNTAIDPSTGEPGNLYTPSYDVMDFNIGYGWGPWRVNGFIRNLLNERYTPSLIAASPATFVTTMIGERRTWGLQVTRSF